MWRHEAVTRAFGLKIRFPPGSVGSSPTSGTSNITAKQKLMRRFPRTFSIPASSSVTYLVLHEPAVHYRRMCRLFRTEHFLRVKRLSKTQAETAVS
jgi:hypothetical protein